MEIEDSKYGHGKDGQVLPIPSTGWKSKWGKKPPGSAHHYSLWRTTYQKYLLRLYQDFLNSSKGVNIRHVDFEEFSSFAYRSSSGYLSPYA